MNLFTRFVYILQFAYYCSSAFGFPKRVADLELSDSEDDKNDRLNCALLNDSFILSPSQDLAGTTPARTEKKTDDENNRNTTNIPTDSGFMSRIKDPWPHDDRTEEDTVKPIARATSSQEDDPLKIAYRPIKTRQQLFPLNSSSSSVLKNNNPVPSIFKKFLENSQTNNNSACIETSQIETPFKKVDDPVFLTPSIRQPSQTTIKKSQNVPLQTLTSVKEKPAAKILFTTPVPRPPTISLIEPTPLEVKKLTASTATCKKLSPITEPIEKSKEQEKLTINGIEYDIDKVIGSGGSSKVFLAKESKSGREVAVKLVDLQGDRAVIEGYLNETKLLAKLQGNINVVSLFDYYHLPEKSMLYMVMEKGESDLHKILQGYRTHLPVYTLVKYWYQMLQAVNYIHANGVIHSDLKPANFLMINGRLKLIDFGIASNIAVDSTSIIKFSQAGTFNYISPEALIDTSTGDSPSAYNQPKIRLSTKSDVSC